MTWASILAGVLKLFNAVAAYFNNKQLLDAGKAKAHGEVAEKNNEFLKDQAKARAAVSGLDERQLDDELRDWDADGPTKP